MRTFSVVHVHLSEGERKQVRTNGRDRREIVGKKPFLRRRQKERFGGRRIAAPMLIEVAGILSLTAWNMRI